MSAALGLGIQPPGWAPVQVTDLDPRPRQHRGHGAGVPARAVRVDRGVFANPFACPDAPLTAQLGALVKYAVWLAGRLEVLTAVRDELVGRDLSCTCALGNPSCHREVLLDVANSGRDPLSRGGRTMGLTLRQPWASMLLVPAQFGGKAVENRVVATDYRGPVLIYGGAQTDEAGIQRGERLGLTKMEFHSVQKGWLGAAVLTDVHRAAGRCCRPWGSPQWRPDKTIYHWVFDHPARLARRGWGRGFEGLRSVSWSALMTPPDKLRQLQPASTAGGEGRVQR